MRGGGAVAKEFNCCEVAEAGDVVFGEDILDEGR